jgi:HEAT repeat protein
LTEGIQSPDVRRAKASIELLRAWERWIPIESFPKLVANQDISLRLAALPALRYASATEGEAAHEIFQLLELPDESVHASAAKAAADMGISELMPLLVNQLRRDGPLAALAAAKALADLGPEGKDLLDNEILSSARPQYALQALEQALIAERG